MKEKEVQMEVDDVVHGLLYLPNHIAQIVETPIFLRLKKIKQLGFLYLLEPQADFGRYDHCIGTYWLAKRMLDALVSNSDWLGNEEKFDFFRRAVEIAGLLHDVGHGPFSHIWEDVIDDYNHEENARECVKEIFNVLTEDNNRDGIIQQFKENNNFGVELVIALIMGSKEIFPFDFPQKFNFIFEIVHNKKCKLDVDKWDYLLRDRFYLKHRCNPKINFESVFLKARPAEDGSCIQFRYEDYDQIYNLFNIRWQFHNEVYRLPVMLALAKLLKSILMKCQNKTILNYPICDIKSKFKTAFLELTDENVLKLIQSEDDAKCLKNLELLTRINQDEIQELDRIIIVKDELVSAGYEMPPDSCFSFYGDKNMKSKIIKEYAKVEKVYYFRIATRDQRITT